MAFEVSSVQCVSTNTKCMTYFRCNIFYLFFLSLIVFIVINVNFTSSILQHCYTRIQGLLYHLKNDIIRSIHNLNFCFHLVLGRSEMQRITPPVFHFNTNSCYNIIAAHRAYTPKICPKSLVVLRSGVLVKALAFQQGLGRTSGGCRFNRVFILANGNFVFETHLRSKETNEYITLRTFFV